MDEDFWSVLFSANVVMTTNGFYEGYLADKNAKTAYDFVSYYSQDEMEDYEADILRFMPDIEAVVEEAKADMPSEHVVSVYEAYVAVQNALAFRMMNEDVYAAVEGFEAVLDAFNEMGLYGDDETAEKDRADLAALMGVEDGETAWYQVVGDWVNINILIGVDAAYQAYLADPSVENAEAFVEVYDGIYNDPAYVDEDLSVLVEEFFVDIHDVYADANAVLADGDTEGQPGGDDEGQPDEEQGEDIEAEDKESSPSTGDQNHLVLWLGMMLAAGAVMFGLKSGRKEN